jgi:Arc/MetJ family transcription regulator
MRKAMQASGAKTKRAAVESTLRLLIQVKAQTNTRRDHELIHNDRDFDSFEQVLKLQVIHP